MSDALALGEVAPPFSLPDTSGEVRSLPAADEAAATVVFWTCNHCPYALGWHDRLVEAARDYADRRVRFLAVNSNDPGRHAADSLERMIERVEREDWPFPYLHDESQTAAREWGARVTPDVFVLDADHVLRYRGAPDADYSDPGARAAWLRAALEAVLEGAEPDPASTEPIGCTIKWRR